MTEQTQPAVWIDGDPLMEAIAAAVWEQCRTDYPSSVVDDPRNIAAVAASVARAVSSAGPAPAPALTDVERRILVYALDVAEEEMLARGDDDDELEAVTRLRRLADEAAVPGRAADETAHSCRNCEGVDPDTCLMNPDRPKPPPMDPVHILGVDADAAPSVGGAQQQEEA